MRRNKQLFTIRKGFIVIRRGALTRSDILVQVRQLRIEDSGLDAVQPTVHAYLVVMVAYVAAVVGDRPHTLRQRIVVGEDRAAVAVATQVLRGEERRAADVAYRTGLLRLAVGEGELCADSLAGVLHHVDMLLAREFHQRLHVGALTEQVHRHDGFRTRRDGATD